MCNNYKHRGNYGGARVRALSSRSFSVFSLFLVNCASCGRKSCPLHRYRCQHRMNHPSCFHSTTFYSVVIEQESYNDEKENSGTTEWLLGRVTCGISRCFPFCIAIYNELDEKNAESTPGYVQKSFSVNRVRVTYNINPKNYISYII